MERISFFSTKKLALWKLTKVIILLWFLAEENNDILEKVKEYGTGRKTSVIQETNYLNKRYSVSLIGFSWTIDLKCAEQRQYLEERNFAFLNHSFSSLGSVSFDKLLLSIYSEARQPKFDPEFYYSTFLRIHFLASEMEMIIVVLIPCDYFEDELNFNVSKVLRAVLATLTQKIHWIRLETRNLEMLILSSWERQVSDPTISVFSDNTKKMFIER